MEPDVLVEKTLYYKIGSAFFIYRLATNKISLDYNVLPVHAYIWRGQICSCKLIRSSVNNFHASLLLKYNVLVL